MSSSAMTLAVGTHTVAIERLERQRWRVSVDGRRFASFCTESRARAAGRMEARRLDFTPTPGDGEGAPRRPGGPGTRRDA
jgi:hypothetical protein